MQFVETRGLILLSVETRGLILLNVETRGLRKLILLNIETRGLILLNVETLGLILPCDEKLLFVYGRGKRDQSERGERRRLEQTNLNSEFATVDAIYLCVFSGHQ